MENNLKVAIRYQSGNGNTKRVAEILASELGIEARKWNSPLEEPVDILLAGSGEYVQHAGKRIKNFIAELPVGSVKKVVAFSTTAMTPFACTDILKTAQKHGFETDKRRLIIFMGLKGHKFFKSEGGRITKKQEQKIREFARAFLMDDMDAENKKD